MKVKVSIIMSTYNETKNELERAIKSILNQTLKEFEFIIILDNPDNIEHKEIINKYLKKDKRIIFLINKSNIGLALSLNKGISIAQSNYIARMDADDISVPTRLEKEYDFLQNNKDVDIVATSKIDIDEDGNVIGEPSYLPSEDRMIKKVLKISCLIIHPSVMFRKDKIQKIGNYRDFPSSQDYDLWLRASFYGLKFAIINEKLIKYTIRKAGISNSNPLKQYTLKKYIQKLYKQRQKKQTDNFSPENLQDYLRKNKVFNLKEIAKFKEGMKYINKAKKAFRQKKIILTLGYFFKSVFCHSKIKYVLYDYIISFLLKVRK